jgi:DNA-binding NarL/FixJ family response regulator
MHSNIVLFSTEAMESTTTPPELKVLAIDDHLLIREGIVSILRALHPGIKVGVADTCAAGISRGLSEPWDLILLDLQLPDQSGLIALDQFRRMRPETPVVIMSALEDRATVMKCLDLGAKAYLPKSSDAAKIRAALSHLLSGGVHIPNVTSFANSPSANGSQGLPWTLTERQVDVLKLVMDGLSNKLIARKLDIAESTVKIHVSAVFREMQVNSRTQALLAVAKSGTKFGPISVS